MARQNRLATYAENQAGEDPLLRRRHLESRYRHPDAAK